MVDKIAVEKDVDTWLYVALAIESRIADLKRLEPTGRLQSLCAEQVALLEQFTSDLRKKILDYAKQNRPQSDNHD